MLAEMAKPKVEKDQVNIRMSVALLDDLDDIGRPYGITRTALITQAVVEFVQRHKAQRQQQPADQHKRK